MICVIFAHPYPSRSRAGRALLEAIRDLPALEVRSLYELYPDFDIDIAAEQQALERAELVLWMHPLYWYSVPALLKHWFDKVLAPGWAFGAGSALCGRHCLWVASSGGDAQSYAPGALHGRPFAELAAPLEQTARFCGMRWEPPFMLHGAHAIDDEALRAHAQRLRTRLAEWARAAATEPQP